MKRKIKKKNIKKFKKIEKLTSFSLNVSKTIILRNINNKYKVIRDGKIKIKKNSLFKLSINTQFKHFKTTKKGKIK